MTRIAISLAGLIGYAVVLRTAAFYGLREPLALAVTLAMGLALGVGLAELLRTETRTRALRDELGGVAKGARPQDLDALRPALRGLLRARLDGTGGAPPAPAFTPFLVGLLVMLGLLGTFLGLFETLRGAREALRVSADVGALRDGLSRPMAGLMQCFGTSAAGVMTSAALGLAAVFVRRDGATLSAELQAVATGPLAHLSPARRQLLALEALAAQGSALPTAAEALSAAVADLRSLEGTWAKAQDRSATQTRTALETLAHDVRSALFEVLPAAAAASRDAVAPVVAEGMRETTEAARAHLERLRELADTESARRLAAEEATAERVDARFESVAARLQEALDTLAERERARAEALAESGRAQAEAIAEIGRRMQGDLQAATETASAHLVEATLAGQARLEEATRATQTRLEEATLTTQARLEEATRAARDRLAATAETEAAQLERAEGLVARLGATSAELATAARAQLSALEAAGRDQREALEAWVTSTASKLEEAEARAETRAGALFGQLGEALHTQAARLEEAEARNEARAAGLFDQLGETLEAQTARLVTLEARVVDVGQERAHELVSLLREHATQVQDGLRETERLAREATAGAQAGGAELLSVAEMFAEAVDRHREAAERWIEGLGAVEKAVVDAGEEAAADALGQHLARTHELFDHQLRFQQDLIDQLRDQERPSDVAPRGGVETRPESVDVTA